MNDSSTKLNSSGKNSKMSNSNKEENSYKSSLKATGITGLAQVIQIIIKIVNTKVIAFLLGPTGVGIIGMFQSTTNLINTISGLGLGSSAVRDIAQAVKQEDDEKISHTILTLRRLVWITGLVGAFFCVLAGPWLSQLSFNSEMYATEFRILGVMVFLSQITAGQMALLQGFRRLKEMAMASVLGGLAGLIFAVPLYWYFGIKGIVPALVILAIVPVVVAWWLAKGIRITRQSISQEKFRQVAIPMVKLGISTMLSGLAFFLSMWLIRILVQRQFGLTAVGQFQAGWGVTTIYLQMIFQAMGRDYFPRLAGMAENPKAMVKQVNEQMHLALLMGTPLLLFAIMGAPWIIQFLYSSKFEEAIPQLQWLALGTLFKLISWPLGFVLLALRKSTVYFFTETFAAAGFLLLSFLLMKPFGLHGVGMAYTLNYILYAIIVLVAARNFIGFQIDKRSLQYLLISLFGIGLVFFSFNVVSQQIFYFLALIISLGISFVYLRKLDQLTGLFKSIWNRIR
jgi:PST family polysaccharide transporter